MPSACFVIKAIRGPHHLDDLSEPSAGFVIRPLGSRVRVLERAAGRLEHLIARAHRAHRIDACEADEHRDAHGVCVRQRGVHAGGHVDGVKVSDGTGNFVTQMPNHLMRNVFRQAISRCTLIKGNQSRSLRGPMRDINYFGAP